MVYLKNTVTNAGYFYSALSLYDWSVKYPDAPGSVPPFTLLTTACLQYNWFNSWIYQPTDAPAGVWDKNVPFHYWRLMNPNLQMPFALIEDRPVGFKEDKGYTYCPQDPLGRGVPWSPDGVWSGDQGLFLAAIALFYKYSADVAKVLGHSEKEVTDIQNNIKQWFPQLANGVFKLLTSDGPAPNDAIFREAPFDFTYKSDYSWDYVCGRGVFARFWSLDETVALFREIFIPTAWGLFNRCFDQTSYAINKSNDGTGQLSAQWTGGTTDLTANKSFFSGGFPYPEGQVPIYPANGYQWDPPKNSTDPTFYAWNNYCMMTGFDFYGAHAVAQDWYYHPPGAKKADDEKDHANGHEKEKENGKECSKNGTK